MEALGKTLEKSNNFLKIYYKCKTRTDSHYFAFIIILTNYYTNENIFAQVQYFAAVTAINSRGHAKPRKFQVKTLSNGTEAPSSVRPRAKSPILLKSDFRQTKQVIYTTTPKSNHILAQGKKMYITFVVL